MRHESRGIEAGSRRRRVAVGMRGLRVQRKKRVLLLLLLIFEGLRIALGRGDSKRRQHEEERSEERSHNVHAPERRAFNY